MTENDELLILYFYQMESYQVFHAFNSQGSMDEKSLHSAYKAIIGGEPSFLDLGTIGSFNSIEDLQKFSFHLCQELGSNAVNLISSEDYNKAFDQAYTEQEFLKNLSECGNKIENLDKNKKGFFGRFI
jgi:hypothetical protein